jgi:hypothetical protein
VATAEHPYVEVGSNVTVLGAGIDQTSLLLATDAPESYRELLRLRGSGITVSGLTMEQGGPVYGVMTRIDASDNLAVYDVRIQGYWEEYPDSTLHGIMLAEEGTVEHVLLERLQVSGVQYGLLQTSEAKTVVRQLTVDHSVFHDNAADDLGLNSPNGSMSAIAVRNSSFADGHGFAVALANVSHAVIQDNDIRGYTKEFVHIEDGSKDVKIANNSFSGNGTNSNDWYSFVFVISGSRGVTIEGNRFTTEPSPYRFRCIYVGPGGDGYAVPTGITVGRNDAVLAGNSTLIDVYGDAGVTVQR